MRRVVGVRHPPDMHELNEDAAALVVHGCGHLAPSGDMCGRVDTRRRDIALSVIAGLRAFGDDQADTRALGIIIGGKVTRRAAGMRAPPALGS